MIKTWPTALPVLALGAFLALSPLVAAQPAHAFGSDSSSSSSDDKDKEKETKEGKALQDIQNQLNKGEFGPALSALVPFTAAHPENADGWNLRGYASRKLGQFDMAFGFYERALAIEPNHKGALEYMGELYVEMGQKDTALELLARLESLCPEGCVETAALKGFIDGTSETAQRQW
jgi:Flp pilus assembly protein TadD